MNMKTEKHSHEELSHIEFHKLKLLYKFSKILHCIEEDIAEDAKNAGDNQFHEFLEEIEENLEEYVKRLHGMLCKKIN